MSVGVDALDFALAAWTVPLWDWSLIGASRCENLIDQTQLRNERGWKKIK